MTNEAVQSQPQPNIYGPISPIQAEQMRAAANPAEFLASPEGAELLAGLGAKTLEADDVAVVLTPAEEGVEPSYKYIALDERNLGDRLIDRTVGELGLPDAKTAYEQIVAKREAEAAGDAESPAASGSEADTPIAAETEAEQRTEVEPGTFNFEDLLKDPNKMLEPGALKELADITTLEQKAGELWSKKDQKGSNDIAESVDFSQRHIFAPEQAATSAREAVVRVATNLGEEVENFSRLYGNLAGELAQPDRSVAQLMDELPQAQSVTRSIMDAIDYRQPLDEGIMHGISRLQQFAEDYYRAKPQLTSAAEQQVGDARRAHVATEEAADNIRRSAGGVQAEAQDAMTGSPERSKLPELAEKVVERGIKTVAGHAQACADDIDTQVGKLMDLSRDVGGVEQSGQELFVALSRKFRATEDLPHVGQIGDAVDQVRSYVRRSFEGSLSNPYYLYEMAEQLSRSLNQLQSNLEDIQAAQRRAGEYAEQTAASSQRVLNGEVLQTVR